MRLKGDMTWPELLICDMEQSKKWKAGYSSAIVDRFNGFIMDICNCLWRNRALAVPGPGDASNECALGCTLPRWGVVLCHSVWSHEPVVADLLLLL